MGAARPARHRGSTAAPAEFIEQRTFPGIRAARKCHLPQTQPHQRNTLFTRCSLPQALTTRIPPYAPSDAPSGPWLSLAKCGRPIAYNSHFKGTETKLPPLKSEPSLPRPFTPPQSQSLSCPPVSARSGLPPDTKEAAAPPLSAPFSTAADEVSAAARRKGTVPRPSGGPLTTKHTKHGLPPRVRYRSPSKSQSLLPERPPKGKTRGWRDKLLWVRDALTHLSLRDAVPCGSAASRGLLSAHGAESLGQGV